MDKIQTGLPEATANGFHHRINAQWFQDHFLPVFDGVSSMRTKLKKHRQRLRNEKQSLPALPCAEDTVLDRCHPRIQTLLCKVPPEPSQLPAESH